MLEVQYRGLNIHQLQGLSISEAIDFFSDEPKIHDMLKALDKTGLGYMTLGQPIPTLSGGEAQRLKIARELGTKRKGKILYIWMSPPQGLFYDTANLLPMLTELVQAGNSVIVIEHDPDVLSFCDHIIELGPGAGADGGQIIARGSPAQLKHDPLSVVGRYLFPQPVMAR